MKLIKEIIEETFPDESNLLGENTMELILSRVSNNQRIEIAQTEYADQLNYYEIAHIIIEAATFAFLVFKFIRTTPTKSNFSAKNILVLIESKGFKKLNDEIKITIIEKLLSK